MQTVQRKEKIYTTFREEEFEGRGKYAPVCHGNNRISRESGWSHLDRDG